MLYSQPQSDIRQPSFYIYRINNSLFVITRGTKVQKDWVSDVEFDEIPTKYGTFLTGFYRASLFVYAVAEKYIKQHDGPIYFIGHSAGASISTVLHCIAAKDFPSKDVNTLAYAPVPSISDDLNKKYGNKIVTFINGHDIVPSLSIPNMWVSVYAICKFAKKLPAIVVSETVKAALTIYNEKKHAFSDEVFKVILDDVPLFVKNLLSYGKGEKRTIRYPPGTVFQFWKNQPKALSKCVIDPVVALSMVVLDPDSINDHLPSAYSAVMKTITSD